MARRPALRTTDLKAAILVMRECSMTPAALDVLPDGTHRWHFTKPTNSDEDDLDAELAEFSRRHGHGGA